MVDGVHERVSGIADDGRPYSAQDPRLLLWVHVGLTDSMLVAYERYGTAARSMPTRMSTTWPCSREHSEW